MGLLIAPLVVGVLGAGVENDTACAAFTNTGTGARADLYTLVWRLFDPKNWCKFIWGQEPTALFRSPERVELYRCVCDLGETSESPHNKIFLCIFISIYASSSGCFTC